ncbi:MAG: 3-hydroxyacyl-CoA dehydrogenase NAD-binding domain-containing protein [Propionibacteriaceae bacterium]
MTVLTGYAATFDLDAHFDAAEALTPDEIVTDALSRDVSLPHGAGTGVLITLDNHHDHHRPTTFGPRGLRSLHAAIQAARARDDVAAIMVTGKPFFLAAGADLTGVPKVTDADAARTIARLGHAVFDGLRTSEVPTFAFVNGVALGGGLEVALNCHYRTVSHAVTAIALPECFLGMVPGWGGCWLLPNLIGAEAAVSVIVGNALSNNTMLAAPQATGLGLMDVCLDAADFLEQSIDWAATVITQAITVDRPEPDRGEAWDAAVTDGRAFADQKVSGTAPAPYRALELISAAKNCTAEEGFAAEDQALSELLLSDELRAGLYAFELVQKRAKKPAGAPDTSLARTVSQVGIVGAGLMASQLALLVARRLEVPVIMSDLDQTRVDKGLGYVREQIQKLTGRGRISPDQANRLVALVRGTTDQADFAGCEFVLEAVFEELEVKKQVFAAVETHVSPECVLATNTSSLPVTAMSQGLLHPERVVGFHFFNPVAVLPLLEVVRGKATDDATVATALATARTLRKNAILVADAPAFVVNRVLTRLMGEVFAAIDEGTPIEVADQALRPLGLPMTPLLLLQLVGPAVALHVADTLRDAFPDRFSASPNLAALVESGRAGFYDWTPDGTPYVPEDVTAFLTVGDQPSTAEQVCERARAALAQEIGLMLQEGVVAAPMDVDLAVILGANWPFHDGGITPYLDRTGTSERVLGRRFLPPGVASVA